MIFPGLKRILWLKASSFYSYVWFSSWLIELGKALHCRGFKNTYINYLFQDEINRPLNEPFLFFKANLDDFPSYFSFNAKTSNKAPQADSQDLLSLSPSYWFDLPEACPWTQPVLMESVSPWVLQQWASPLSALVLAGASLILGNFPHGALFRWPRWASLIINQKNIFAFKGCIMFTFMHQFKVILHMHSLTKLKQCLRLQYNLQLNKPQNK